MADHNGAYQTTSGVKFLAISVVAVVALLVIAALAVPVVFPPRIQPTRTPVPSRPQLISIVRDGTCQSFTYRFEFYDADGDAARIEQLDGDGNVNASIRVPVGSSSFTWTGWSCNSRRCVSRFQIVDATGRTSNLSTSDFTCS